MLSKFERGKLTHIVNDRYPIMKTLINFTFLSALLK